MKFSSGEEELLDINLTPLIDVVFLLLIFFMVSTTFVTDCSIDVELPEASSGNSKQEKEIKTLSINASGDYFFDGQKISKPALKTKLLKTKELVIKADKTASHGAVVSALDTAKEAGVKSLNIATEKSSP